MCAGKDEDGLVGIRQQHLLIIALRPRVEPDDGRSRFSTSSIAPLPSSETVIRTLSPIAARSPVALPCFNLPRN